MPVESGKSHTWLSSAETLILYFLGNVHWCLILVSHTVDLGAAAAALPGSLLDTQNPDPLPKSTITERLWVLPRERTFKSGSKNLALILHPKATGLHLSGLLQGGTFTVLLFPSVLQTFDYHFSYLTIDHNYFWKVSFILYIWVLCLHVFTCTHACLVHVVAIRGGQIPWNWGHEWL